MQMVGMAMVVAESRARRLMVMAVMVMGTMGAMAMIVVAMMVVMVVAVQMMRSGAVHGR
jgi:hypothetical protein